MSKNPNKHIEEYLNWYLREQCKEPRFAVLIKGGWGSGKTRFVKKFIETENKKNKNKAQNTNKFIYISLYGLSSTNDINALIFQELHPILASKGANVAGKVLKGILRLGLKVDFNNDGKTDATLSPTVPNINFAEYLNKFEDKILIFDDLERCNIPSDKVFGYINSFVEHESKKVIIIANDEEIECCLSRKKKKAKSVRYHQIKEKVIGKTFKIKSDIPTVIDSLIEEHAQDSKKVLLEKKDLLIDIFETVKNKTEKKHANYRAFSHAIKDFDYIWKDINPKYTGRAELTTDFLNIFIRLAYELQLGQIKKQDVLYFEVDEFSRSSRGLFKTNSSTEQEKKDTKCEVINDFIDRHNLNSSDLILEPDIWAQILCETFIDLEKIHESFKNSKYFIDKTRPYWVRLWHFWDLEDEPATKLIKKIIKKLKRHEYKDVGVIFHIYSSLLFLSEEELRLPDDIGNTSEDIVKHAKKYIDYLDESDALPNSMHKAEGFWKNSTYSGLGYHPTKSGCFDEIRDYFFEKCRVKLLNMTDTQIQEFLERMIENTRQFYWNIAQPALQSSKDEQNYYLVPIFCNIQPKLFLDSYKKTPNAEISFIDNAFAERYQHINRDPSLKDKFPEFKDELIFMKKLKELIDEKAGANKSFTPTIRHMRLFKDHGLKIAIDALENFTVSKS